MTYFGFDVEPLDPHLCCDNCEEKCLCSSCQAKDTVNVTLPPKQTSKRNASSEVVKASLLHYFAAQNAYRRLAEKVSSEDYWDTTILGATFPH